MTEDSGTPQSCAISLERLNKSFGPHYALRNIDLQVKYGERLAIVGPNGAGKTTLLKIIATIMNPTSGKVLVSGLDARKNATEVRRRLGIVAHQPYLYGNLTVYENLDFYCRMYGITDRKQRIREVVEIVGMKQRLNDRTGTLSHGMQQRLSIVRAMLHEPDIMLMDEPEAGLDQQSLPIVRQVLKGNEDRKPTTVLTTHNLERALQTCDSIALLCRGKLVYQGKTEALDLTSLKNVYEEYTGASR
jgi:heme exporter protein A